jgi:hypothetical protein
VQDSASAERLSSSRRPPTSGWLGVRTHLACTAARRGRTGTAGAAAACLCGMQVRLPLLRMLVRTAMTISE